MNGRVRFSAIPTIVAAGALALVAAGSASAAFSPGSGSLGDPIFPQIGNGGYDVQNYEIELNYEPGTNSFEAGTMTTVNAVATQDLSRFSLDFQKQLEISGVSVNGAPATYSRAAAKPRLSRDPDVTQPAKLTVTPAAGIADDAEFEVQVSYFGRPRPIVDTDRSSEGWLPACSSPGNCDGSYTVNEPIGAQSWFPANNHPSDKATFVLRTTAPTSYTAIGPGELISRTPNGDGTATTTWSEDSPMATYLSTGTVGQFDVDEGTMVDQASGSTIQTFTAIDSAGSAQRRTEVLDTAARIPEMVNFLSERFGPYPFGTVGVVADWVPTVGYALENQTKPHFAGNDGGPAVDPAVLAHELAHQWMGDSISPERWTDIWFNEGWATFAEVLFDAKVEGGELSPRRFFRDVHGVTGKAWNLQPARLDGDPAKLFNLFAVYNRPGAMVEGYRQIVGDPRFYAFAKDLGERYAYGNIKRRQFVREAELASGFRGRKLKRLGRYFHQWLLWDRRPRLTPSDFRR